MALLGYAADDPRRAAFWPFAVFSPEWQAIRWAVAHGVPVRFFDLPYAYRIGRPDPAAIAGAPRSRRRRRSRAGVAPYGPSPDADEDAGELGRSRPTGRRAPPLRPVDPIGELAAAAGYDDPERWWEDVVEHRGMPAFEAIAEAMTAIREYVAGGSRGPGARGVHADGPARGAARARQHRRGLRRLARARADPQGRGQGRRRAAQGPHARARWRSPGCRGRTGGWRPGPVTAPACAPPAGTTTCSPPADEVVPRWLVDAAGVCGPRACRPRRRTSSRPPGSPRRWPRCAGGRSPAWRRSPRRPRRSCATASRCGPS